MPTGTEVSDRPGRLAVSPLWPGPSPDTQGSRATPLPDPRVQPASKCDVQTLAPPTHDAILQPWAATSAQVTVTSANADGNGVELTSSGFSPMDRGAWWGGWDSNPRPTDYESFEDLGDPCQSMPILAVFPAQKGFGTSPLLSPCQPSPILVSNLRPEPGPDGHAHLVQGRSPQLVRGSRNHAQRISLPTR